MPGRWHAAVDPWAGACAASAEPAEAEARRLGGATRALAVQLVVTLREMPDAQVRTQLAAAMARLEGLERQPDAYAQVRAVERDVLPRGRERGVVRAEPDREEAYFREVLLLVLLRKRLLVRWSQGAMKGCVDCTPVRIQR